jgi:hypothetical protein
MLIEKPKNHFCRRKVTTATNIEEIISRKPPTRRVEFEEGQREIRYLTPRIIDLLKVSKKGNKYYVVTTKEKA